MTPPLPRYILTVWRLIDPGAGSVIFEGDPCFWRWPWTNVRRLTYAYGTLGIVILPLAILTIISSSSVTINSDGEIQKSIILSQALTGGALLVFYFGLPLLLGLRRPIRWEATFGLLRIHRKKIPVVPGVLLRIKHTRHTTRHGQGFSRIQVTRGHIHVELIGPKINWLLAVFDEFSATEIRHAIQRLAQSSGASFEEVYDKK